MGILERFLKKEERPSTKEKQIVLIDQERELEEEISLLAKKEKDIVKEVDNLVDTTIKEAAKESLKDLKLLEEGRCPECGQKAQQFLYTGICTNCGWASFITPEKGKTIVHLIDGRTVECENAFDTKDYGTLCLKNGVVSAKIPKEKVNYIEYAWNKEEIEEKKKKIEMEKTKVCSWCGKLIEKENLDEIITVYVAFGISQERHYFCSLKCKKSFQRQYPARIHRNCYERFCSQCNECVKKYEVSIEEELKMKKLEEKLER
jgi:hypothetical protein